MGGGGTIGEKETDWHSQTCTQETKRQTIIVKTTDGGGFLSEKNTSNVVFWDNGCGMNRDDIEAYSTYSYRSFSRCRALSRLPSLSFAFAFSSVSALLGWGAAGGALEVI